MAVIVALLLYLGAITYLLRAMYYHGNPADAQQRAATRVATLGLLAAVTAIMQGSPHFLPGIGMVLAAFSSLPIAVGALTAPRQALAMVLATAALLGIIQVEEVFVFALTTAPVGLAAAWAVAQRRPWWQALGLPAIALASGIIVLSELIGIPALGPGVQNLSPVLAMAVYIGFGCLYASLWVGLIAKIRARVLSRLDKSIE